MLPVEKLSIRFVTVMIITMIGLVAIVLSLFAGSFFRQSALDSQIGSLSRVIEVASAETLRSMRNVTFDLGMRLGQAEDVVQHVRHIQQAGARARLVSLLDDPFVNGFVGFSNVNLEKIRVYDAGFNLLAESSRGRSQLPGHMPDELRALILQRQGVDRLKAVDVLWLSPAGPLNSTLVPIGGLKLAGYLEIIVDPAFNLPDVGNITKTPVDVFAMNGEQLNHNQQAIGAGHLPVDYFVQASDGRPAFRIVGYEDVTQLNAEMKTTQWVTTSGFLLLTLGTLLFALWLFNRFLFQPLQRMRADMQQIARGKFDIHINKNGLRDFSLLARAFDTMASQIRQRTGDLERLLDRDDSALLCFGSDHTAVYMNSSAADLFGYTSDELSDLEVADFFDEATVTALVNNTPEQGSVSLRIQGRHKDGADFEADALISSLGTVAGRGHAVMLNRIHADAEHAPEPPAVQNEQRMNAIEQSLSSLMEIARNNPGMVAGLSNIEQLLGKVMPDPDKNQLRQQAVNVMTAALACWQHDLGKSKLALAEESRIWPVYIDKSTPTTRTLDKYLNLDSCPKNPRCQRVIETAEFVLRKSGDRDTAYKHKLLESLEILRSLIAGS